MGGTRRGWPSNDAFCPGLPLRAFPEFWTVKWCRVCDPSFLNMEMLTRPSLTSNSVLAIGTGTRMTDDPGQLAF
jgi:hypothetical protein